MRMKETGIFRPRVHSPNVSPSVSTNKVDVEKYACVEHLNSLMIISHISFPFLTANGPDLRKNEKGSLLSSSSNIFAFNSASSEEK